MHVPSRALSIHRVVTALLCLPPVVGLAILMLPDNEMVGGPARLSWPVPVICLAAARRWSAAGLVAAGMAALSLAGLGWVYLTWTRTDRQLGHARGRPRRSRALAGRADAQLAWIGCLPGVIRPTGRSGR
jgi:hypothetical protein